MKRLKKFIIPTIIFSLFITSPAHANIGIPMIFVTFPGMLLALLPIIAIESKIHFRYFSFDKIRIIKYTALTNSVSTIFGIPVAWLIHTALFLLFGHVYSELFPAGNFYSISGTSLFLQATLGAAWLGPINDELFWMVPAACIFLLIPYFFVSWFVEYFIMRKLIKNDENELCKSATLNANLVSYAFLMIVAVVWLLASILEKKVSFFA